MRLRLSFKLHGDEADLARQLADAAGMPVDNIAKLAMQRYMRDVIDRAEQMMRAQQSPPNEGLPDGLQSGAANPVHAEGTVSPAQDAIPSEET